jgi:cobaltochelatase CobN
MKIDGLLVLSVLFLLVLAPVASADENELTFVLGNDYNKEALDTVIAMENLSIDINVYNATEANTTDFSKEK